LKRIIVVLEALDYNYIAEVNPPNIMSIGDVHPAVSFGLGSRPSTGALLGGMLPICQIPMCYHRDIQGKWSNPYFFTTMRKLTEKQFYLCPNGWCIELLLPWIDDPKERAMNFRWNESHPQLPAREITDYFLREKDKYNSYFAYLHFFETHWPFYSPIGHGTGDPTQPHFEYRKASLLFLDEQVGRVLRACEDAEIVLCSDHNLPPHVVSAATDVPAPKTMLSFIATNFKDCRHISKEIDTIKLAKEEWL